MTDKHPKKTCPRCKRRRMVQVKIWARGRILGWECEWCGAREAIGHPFAPGWLTPKMWVGGQRLRSLPTPGSKGSMPDK